ncbi:Coiled-coil protein [Entamoeba marina]
MSSQDLSNDYLYPTEDQLQYGKEMTNLINSKEFNEEEYNDEQLLDMYKAALQYSVYFSEKRFGGLNESFKELRSNLEEALQLNDELKKELQNKMTNP